jgi:hypothetical protein
VEAHDQLVDPHSPLVFAISCLTLLTWQIDPRSHVEKRVL